MVIVQNSYDKICTNTYINTRVRKKILQDTEDKNLHNLDWKVCDDSHLISFNLNKPRPRSTQF